MTFEQIRQLPVTVTVEAVNGPRVHESCLRGFQIVEKVKELLADGAPASVILAIIEDLQSAPKSDHKVYFEP